MTQVINPTVVEASFGHPANGEGGWYVEVEGTYEDVMGEAGRDLAEASAYAHGWDGGRADAGWPSKRNLRVYRRAFWFNGQGTWAYHLDCWCRHKFCPHTNRQGDRCEAPAPFTKVF